MVLRGVRQHGVAARTRGLVTLLWVAAAALTTPLTGRDAQANGAFPDALQILLSRNNPRQIVLGTTFGLVSSEDGGKTWSWSCEQRNSVNGNLYQLGPAPLERLYALSVAGLVFTDDGSCTWTIAGGSLASVLATDAFVEPMDPQQVWALGSPIGAAGSPGVYHSTDSAQTFGPSLYDDSFSGALTSIEVARSDPQTIYVARYDLLTCDGGDGAVPDGASDASDAQSLCEFPKLLRSTDGGAHWDQPIDLQPTLGKGTFRIIAVDPTNPRHIFLRFMTFDVPMETLAISDDAGLTFRQPISVNGKLTAFLWRADNTLLVTGLTDAGPVGFRSVDGGATFSPWTGIPSLRALAERDGLLYGATDWVKDGYALQVSTDVGLTFAPVMTFSDVHSVKACVKAACEMACDYQAGLTLWSPDTCHPEGVLPNPPVGKKTGCGCVTGDDGPGATGNQKWQLASATLAAAVFWLASRRRRCRIQSGPSNRGYTPR
jgi:MYXO-CTERM domain-containing protein